MDLRDEILTILTDECDYLPKYNAKFIEEDDFGKVADRLLKLFELRKVGVMLKDKKIPTLEEWYDDIYTQMYLKESAFKKYFEMSEEELLLRYKKKFKIKP